MPSEHSTRCTFLKETAAAAGAVALASVPAVTAPAAPAPVGGSVRFGDGPWLSLRGPIAVAGSSPVDPSPRGALFLTFPEITAPMLVSPAGRVITGEQLGWADETTLSLVAAGFEDVKDVPCRRVYREPLVCTPRAAAPPHYFSYRGLTVRVPDTRRRSAVARLPRTLEIEDFEIRGTLAWDGRGWSGSVTSVSPRAESRTDA